MRKLAYAIILAGGEGTRIRNLFPDIPKPLVPLNSISLIERTIDHMKIYGFDRFIITVGYMADKIINYLGDGSRLGVKIEYFREENPLGSGGALPCLANKLRGTVAVVSGDIVFNIYWHEFLRFHYLHRADVSLLVHPTLHPWDSDIVVLHHGWVKNEKWYYDWDSKDRVIGFYKKGEIRPNTVRNIANAGIMLIESDILRAFPCGEKMNLEHDIVFPLIKTHRIYGYRSPEYVKDAGTPERLRQVEEDIKKGKVSYWNLAIKKPAVFWDRDGTLNVYKGYITDPDEIELMPGVGEKIKEFREKGYLNIVITNQPHISFGNLTFERLEDIHGRLETILAREGTYLDDIFFCPTHTDRGFEGEIPELKGDFSCRKPRPGMVYEAADRYNVDIRSSIVIGDTNSDRLLAEQTQMKFFEIGDVFK